MDGLEETGVNENFSKQAGMTLEHTDELIGRGSIEITLELDMKTIAFFRREILKLLAIERLLKIST